MRPAGPGYAVAMATATKLPACSEINLLGSETPEGEDNEGGGLSGMAHLETKSRRCSRVGRGSPARHRRNGAQPDVARPESWEQLRESLTDRLPADKDEKVTVCSSVAVRAA
ncbi:hypothetical protein AAFF_G00060560 [Aldrovandia affinis]|uniref:Uncharacterized protein n=1 Tax=Aldrovandia affinis TaxID=143900 RepID=A0AAD7WE92_9TELE|nr:hypothetical protein AAFF_G00060560 [Aldrovandia affinis]